MDIAILIYLCYVISKLAANKSLPKGRWILRTVIYWMLGDLTAMYLVQYLGGIKVTPESLQIPSMDMLYVLVAGILGGFLGFLLVKKQLQDYPAAYPDKE